MVRNILLVCALALGLACSEAPAPEPPAASTLSAEGKRFDPPVEKSEIPAGAWMCDMGTVHFAAGEKHDKCPVCGMKLVQKP